VATGGPERSTPSERVEIISIAFVAA
jgi:hypothetical protein